MMKPRPKTQGQIVMSTSESRLAERLVKGLIRGEGALPKTVIVNAD